LSLVSFYEKKGGGLCRALPKPSLTWRPRTALALAVAQGGENFAMPFVAL